MAMENGGLSPSDVALLNNNGFGDGGAFMWIFALLILANGGFGGGFGNNGNSNAIQNDINRGFDNQNLQAQTRDILSAVTNGTAQSVAAANQVYHDLQNNFSDKYSELARDIAAVQVSQQQDIANQNECCGSIKMMIADAGANLSAQIAQNKYDNMLALAGLEQRLTSKMDQNKIEALQNQVNKLQLDQATAGMLRFPNSWSYGAGPFPPIFGCCPGNGYNNI
jgi:hypothetical protein